MGGHKREQDHFGKRAKKEGYAARSVYKLSEIQDRFRIIHRGNRVLDLGCFPGSWTQFASKKVGPGGFILGIDFEVPAMAFPPNVVFIEGSVFDLDPVAVLELHRPAHVVLSDMAPNTTGIRMVDQLRAYEVGETALRWAEVFLRPGGNFVLKLFQGPDAPDLIRRCRRVFEIVRTFKPAGCRRESMETYLIATGFKREPKPKPEIEPEPEP